MGRMRTQRRSGDARTHDDERGAAREREDGRPPSFWTSPAQHGASRQRPKSFVAVRSSRGRGSRLDGNLYQNVSEERDLSGAQYSARRSSAFRPLIPKVRPKEGTLWRGEVRMRSVHA